MLGECLGRSPQVENLGETDSRAFTAFYLRDDQTIEDVLENCPCEFMVLKPLKDSHRVEELLSLGMHGKAIWAYRHFADRINSAVERFGRHPLDVFGQFQRGEGKAW